VVGVDRVRAWRPAVPGVAEVFHAEWREHAYPAHTHDTWTLLLVDDGLIGYELERKDHGATPRGVTLLPPHVAHDGHAVSSRGFRKRVVFVSRLDEALIRGEDLEAEARLSLVIERLGWHLAGRQPGTQLPPAAWVAQQARDRFDADPIATPNLAVIAEAVGVSVAHLVRSFTRSYGIPPHRYLVGRRLDAARHRLLAGEDAASVATAAGFYDQAHLTRHFKRLLATTPGWYQRSGAPSSSSG
jgi:AraC-like DNA-binding protein